MKKTDVVKEEKGRHPEPVEGWSAGAITRAWFDKLTMAALFNVISFSDFFKVYKPA
ncbi:MAG: hypothetical protein ACXVAY_09180 [Mucilaginibacter sp.]